jgi:hypothetical protein
MDGTPRASIDLDLLRTREDEDAVGREAEALAEQVAHAVDVVDGALELVPGAGVADPHEQRALLAAAGTRVARRQLGKRRRGGGGGRRRLRRRQGVDEALDEPHGGVVQAVRAALDARDGVAERAPHGARPGGHGQARAAAGAPRRARRRPRARCHGAGRRGADADPRLASFSARRPWNGRRVDRPYTWDDGGSENNYDDKPQAQQPSLR